MFELALKDVRKKINRLHRRGKLVNKDICLFGVSDNTRQIIQVLRELGYEPVQIIDNDRAKQNSYCSRLKVVSPKDIASQNKIVLIYSFFWKEMYMQLLKEGFEKSQLYVLIERRKTVGKEFFASLIGKKLYNGLVKKYGEIPLFLCPYSGTGDIYLIGTFWEEYIYVNKIENYVFLVINNACRKVASLFKIEHIELIKQSESRYLIQYYLLCPTEINLKLLNDGWGQICSNSSEWFRGYKGMYFTELFRKFVFNLPDTSKPKHPQFMDVSVELQTLFQRYNLVEKKTVIISPYSNTLSDLPDEFWRKIVIKLLDKGYKVCTNSSGEHEPAIAGSIAVFFPLNIAPQFVEKAGIFIGVRSGFCDVISAAKAKKIILYDKDNRFYNSSAYDYFSLNKMGLCEDAIEIEFEWNENNLIEKLLKILTLEE